jgi:hypothetical protein
MTETYFSKFPLTRYSNAVAVDITKRVKLLDRVSNNPFAFYPYDIADGERADNFSYRYYDDPYLSWLLYLGNNIVDPYYEWYLQPSEFEDYIIKKYGSAEYARNKIKFYRNDWENKEPLSLSGYNALPEQLKVYWKPVFTSTAIKEYKRVEQDWSFNTNKIVSYTVSNTSFTVDEVCDIVFAPGQVGKGQVVQSSNNTLNLKNISGTFTTSNTVTITSNSYIYGSESQVNTVFIAVQTQADVIPVEELIYYTPISYYDYEYEKNDFNRSIRVIDSKFASLAADNLRTLMSE